MEQNEFVKITTTGISLSIQVQPQAARTEWSGIIAGSLKLRLAAKPVDGEANKALCSFLAEVFSVPKSTIVIKHGQSGRKKVVLIEGDPERLMKLAMELLKDG